MLLPPKSFRYALMTGKYLYSLTDDLFWKNKVDRDYYFLNAFLQDKTDRDRYYIFSSGVTTGVLFEHKRDGIQSLESKIKIGDLLKENIELVLLASILGIEDWEMVMIQRRFDNIKNITNTHFGDCIKMACTCMTCYYEYDLTEGLKLLNDWKNVYDMGIFDIACVLISIKPLHEQRYQERFSPGGIQRGL